MYFWIRKATFDTLCERLRDFRLLESKRAL